MHRRVFGLLRAARLPVAGAAFIGSCAQVHRVCRAEESRFQELPESLASQRFVPAVPYPGWDDNWDWCDISVKEVAKRLGQSWPITDYETAIHKLYAEHSDKPPGKVDELIRANKGDLPMLFKRAFLQ